MTSSPGIHARAAGAADLPALAALMVEFYAESGLTLAPAAAGRTFAALLDAPDRGGVWLLECDGAPAGFVVLTVAFSMEYGGLRGFVDDFFVRPSSRRRGLGALGLHAVREDCVRRRVRALLVETGPDNAAALGVYRHAGFADTGHVLLKMELDSQVHLAPCPEHAS